MRAIVFTKYGSPDVLKLKQLTKPLPKDNEVLIRIHATAVSFGDISVRDLKGKSTPNGRYLFPET